MRCEIIKMDHYGRGISYIEDKIIFIENALPKEVVEVKITHEASKYAEGNVVKYVEKSKARTKSKCPYYESCGGCHLRHMSYDDTLTFKKNKLQEIFLKYANQNITIEVIKNKNKDFYRNKVEIQIKNGEYGFYKTKSHELIELDRCLNVEESINSLLLSTHLLNIQNGTLTIKTNYNGEIILDVKTDDENKIEIDTLREKCKLVGIIYNDKLIFGADHFIEIIENFLFKETYNSFFQVNRYINGELFKIIRDNIETGSTVLDLCCGVGTLSIVASQKAKKVYGIEIVENAIKDAIINTKMNKIENVYFILGDANKLAEKIEDKIDTIIIDPPRSGLNKEGLDNILKISPNKIIYISCDPITQSRDFSILKDKYKIEKNYLIDMFSYTYHIESAMILRKK